MKLSRLIAFGGTLIIAVAVMVLLFTALHSPIVRAAPNGPQGNGGATVLNLSVGSSHACVTMSNGRLLCWGTQSAVSPVLGDGTGTTRYMSVDVSNITNGATSIAGGGTVSCAIVNGSVKCWGGNTQGQLGTGNNTASNVPTDVVGLSSGVTSIAAGVHYACAIAAGGAAKCWGLNDNGQLGNNSNQPSNVPVDVVGLSSSVSAIAARQNHTCAVVSGGAKCWGANFSGQLGNGNNSQSQVPVDVSGLLASSSVTAIAAGVEHSCAIVNGAVKCWGSNQYGQLGTGNITNTTAPTDVIGLSSGVTSIAAGGWHSCVLTSGGGVKCWGRNDVGQLGISSTQSISIPVDVQGLTSGVAAIAAGGNAAGNSTTCALLNSGKVKCWGNDAGLGQGYFSGDALVPRTVLGLPDECIFTTAFGDDWANARNWSNCGGAIPQAGDNVVIGRTSTAGIVPQVYATTTVSLNRLRVIGSFFMNGSGTVNHVFGDNIANLNPNPNQNNFRFYVVSPASLTVTQRLTWTIGYLDGTGNVIIQPGAVGTVQGTSPSIVNAVDAHMRNYGTFNMNSADMGSQWINETGGVMNFTGGVDCCGTSGHTFTNRGIVNITGTNRIVPIYQYSGAINVNGVMTRSTNFFGVYLYGGALNGTGIISDAVDNIGGVVAPGGPNNAGSLTIADYYRQSPTATLSIDIGGSITGTFDQLKMSNTGEQPFYPGNVSLSGTLNLHQLGGFTPSGGDEIRFMTFNQRNGFFGTFNNAFGPAFIPAAFSTYVALIEGSGANVRLSAKADAYGVPPGVNNGYTIAFENPFNQSITVQALTHTLPISITYRPGTSSGGGDPAITTINGRQQLRWNLAQPIGAASSAQFKFGVAINPSATLGTYTSTIAARTSANAQDASLSSAAAMLIQQSTTVSNTFTLPGTVIPRSDLPPLINVTRGNSDEPFLVQTYLACPPGKTCNDPNTDLFSVTLKVAGFSYTMTAGIAPPTPTLHVASLRAPVAKQSPENIEIASSRPSTPLRSAQGALLAMTPGKEPNRPAWANPPPYFHWEPGIPCDQQLPEERCDPGPDNPYRTPDCPIPIVIIIYWADGSITEELIGCMALYDPSGYVRNVNTSQPITNATVLLYKVPFALPDTSTQTRDCRTIETRPGGVSGNWNSLPPANISTGLLEDPTFSPPRIDPPANPQLTDAEGHYGWDVTTGCWFVVVSAPGYVTKISPAVGVPPEVTDLDMYLIPEGAYKVYLPLVRK
jgi:alpha-tubulin suppressor-like RCC1 family protein